MSEFAGTLRERIRIERRVESRSAAGLSNEEWEPVGECMAAIRSDGVGAEVEGGTLSRSNLYRVTLRRKKAVSIDQRVRWGARVLRVRQVVDDPGLPDRLILRCEEER